MIHLIENFESLIFTAFHLTLFFKCVFVLKLHTNMATTGLTTKELNETSDKHMLTDSTKVLNWWQYKPNRTPKTDDNIRSLKLDWFILPHVENFIYIGDKIYIFRKFQLNSLRPIL